MGFDVSYHPITANEIEEWYFNRLPEVAAGDFSVINSLAEKYNIHEFYVEKYIDTLKASLNYNDEDLFDKTHAFGIAITQGFFRTYFYVRGGAFTFAVEEYPGFKQYIIAWPELFPNRQFGPVNSMLSENYCAGVYLPNTALKQLMDDYRNNADIKAKLDKMFSHKRIDIFLKAVQYCLDNGLDLLEATEVVEPNPLDLNSSSSYSNLFNCDTEGALLYVEAARAQIAATIAQSEPEPGKPAEPASQPKEQKPAKKGFFSKLFKK